MVIFSTAVQCANRQVPILIRLTTSSSPEENDSILLSFFFFLSLHTCTIIDGLLVSVVCTISLLSQRALSFSAAPIYPTTQFLRSATFTKGKFYFDDDRHLPRIINKRFFLLFSYLFHQTIETKTNASNSCSVYVHVVQIIVAPRQVFRKHFSKRASSLSTVWLYVQLQHTEIRFQAADKNSPHT